MSFLVRIATRKSTSVELGAPPWRECLAAQFLLGMHLCSKASREKEGGRRRQFFSEMQRAQNEAVRTPFTSTCSGFSSEINASAQSPAPGNNDDYQITFSGPPSTTFPQKHWYFDRTFVAPCSGWYSAAISVTGLKAPKGLKLVRTWRYAESVDLPDLSGKPSQEVSFYLHQYDAIALALASSVEARSIESARLTIRWEAETKPKAALELVQTLQHEVVQNLPHGDPIRLLLKPLGMFAAVWERDDACDAVVISKNHILAAPYCRDVIEELSEDNQDIGLYATNVELDFDELKLKPDNTEKLRLSKVEHPGTSGAPGKITISDDDARAGQGHWRCVSTHS